jgi:hypothetical protein
MVFADPGHNAAAPLGNRLFVPVSGDGFVKLLMLSFDGAQGTALFGNKDELLVEWRQRLGLAGNTPDAQESN